MDFIHVHRGPTGPKLGISRISSCISEISRISRIFGRKKRQFSPLTAQRVDKLTGDTRRPQRTSGRCFFRLLRGFLPLFPSKAALGEPWLVRSGSQVENGRREKTPCSSTRWTASHQHPPGDPPDPQEVFENNTLFFKKLSFF